MAFELGPKAPAFDFEPFESIFAAFVPLSGTATCKNPVDGPLQKPADRFFPVDRAKNGTDKLRF
jgi:hypothetical protein